MEIWLQRKTFRKRILDQQENNDRNFYFMPRSLRHTEDSDLVFLQYLSWTKESFSEYLWSVGRYTFGFHRTGFWCILQNLLKGYTQVRLMDVVDNSCTRFLGGFPRSGSIRTWELEVHKGRLRDLYTRRLCLIGVTLDRDKEMVCLSLH